MTSRLERAFLDFHEGNHICANLWPRIKQMPNGCWEWQGFCRPNGYGQFYTRVKGRSILVHRTVYEILSGPIPEGMELDHLCRNKNCCNPKHLEAVTHKENIRRGLPFRNTPSGKDHCYGSRTHCKNGHEYTESNTYLALVSGTDRKHRRCRRCAADLQMIRRAKIKASQEAEQ